MAMLSFRRSDAERLSAAFATALGGGAAPSTGAGELIGLEHEFRVLFNGQPVDFSRLIHTLPIDGLRVDPADPNAYRGPRGEKITCDEREAEIAVAPIARGPGCTAVVVERAHAGRATLSAALPEGAELEGFSTHLSVAVPDNLVERTAQIYSRTFAPALMLLLDGPESPGLLVRPRRGRLELCGEFADGDRLRASMAFALGSTMVAARAARRRPFAGRRLPAAIDLRVEPAQERYGWFVSRTAPGLDLYAAGRSTVLQRAQGGTVTAGAHLVDCWASARAAIATLVAPADLEATDRVVAGLDQVGVELSQHAAISFHEPEAKANSAEANRVDPTLGRADPFGQVMADCRRPGFRVRPVVLTWEFAVLSVDDGKQIAYACLPRPLLGAGLEALGAGRLDQLLLGYLAAQERAASEPLATPRQTGSAGLYGGLARSEDLLVAERAAIGQSGERPGKRRDGDDPPVRASRPEQPASVFTAGTPRSPALAATAAGAARRRILRMFAGLGAAVGVIAVVAVIGGIVMLGQQTGVAPASEEPSMAAALPSEGGSPSAGPPGSVVASARSSPLPPDFSGTFDVTAVVSSIGFLGNLPEPDKPPLTPGTVLKYRVDIACEPTSCLVTTGPLPPRSPNVQVMSIFVFPFDQLARDGATLSFAQAGTGRPDCDWGDWSSSYLLAGTNPMTVDNNVVFGGFTGSLVNTFERLEGTTRDGRPCYPIGFDLKVTGIRVDS